MKRQQYFYFLVGNTFQKYHHCATGRIGYTSQGIAIDRHGIPAYYAATEDGTPITHLDIYNFPSQQHYQNYILRLWRQTARSANMQDKKQLLMTSGQCIIPTDCFVTTLTWRQRYKFEVSVQGNDPINYPLRTYLTKPQAIQLAADLNKQIKEIWK